jgi:hypothetical protein
MKHEPDLLRRERPLRFLAGELPISLNKVLFTVPTSPRERVKFNVQNTSKGHRQGAATALANFVAHEQVCKC